MVLTFVKELPRLGLQSDSFLRLHPDENLSEDDINECEREEPLHEDEQVPPPGDAKKKKRSKEDR